MCKGANLRICNGRFDADDQGKYTFNSSNGASVIDYVLCDANSSHMINLFKVLQLYPQSDHSPVILHMGFKQCTTFNVPRYIIREKCQKYVCDDNSKMKISACLSHVSNIHLDEFYTAISDLILAFIFVYIFCINFSIQPLIPDLIIL